MEPHNAVLPVQMLTCSSSNRVDELVSENKDLKAQVAARDQFLAIATHELRNPMHALAMQITAVQMMATSNGNEAIAARLQKAQSNLQWFLKRSTLLLDVSRMAAGMHRLELGPVDLREVLRRVEDLYSAPAQLGEISLNVECHGPLIGRWDALALEQVLGNLVSNAIKYGAGSPIEVTAEDPGTGVVKVRVADRGSGISHDDQKRMFNRFDEVMLTVDQRKGGFGIGLWLARNLVEAHGGRLQVFSVPQSGSTFTLSLPKISHPVAPMH